MNVGKAAQKRASRQDELEKRDRSIWTHRAERAESGLRNPLYLGRIWACISCVLVKLGNKSSILSISHLLEYSSIKKLFAMHYSKFQFLFSASGLLHLANSSPVSSSSHSPTCRYIPGDNGWPSVHVWNQLNSSVSGRLIATVPIASVCHDPNYNAAECSVLQGEWDFAAVQYVWFKILIILDFES